MLESVSGITYLALPVSCVAFIALLVIRPAWPTRSRWTGWIVWYTWLVPLAYTLTPGITEGVGRCLRGMHISGVGELLSGSEPALNVWLFVPAGAAVWLVPTMFRRVSIWLGLAFEILFIEMTQEIFSTLNRQCQLGDMLNNSSGVFLGAIAGGIVWGIFQLWFRYARFKHVPTSPSRRL